MSRKCIRSDLVTNVSYRTSDDRDFRHTRGVYNHSTSEVGECHRGGVDVGGRRGGERAARRARSGGEGAPDSRGGFRGWGQRPGSRRAVGRGRGAAGAPMSGPVQRSADVWRRAGDALPAPRCSRVSHSAGDTRLSIPRRAINRNGRRRRALLRRRGCSTSQVPEVARGGSTRIIKAEDWSRTVAAARPLYFIRCSGDNGSRRLLEYTYRVGGFRRAVPSEHVVQWARGGLARVSKVSRGRGDKERWVTR